MVLHRLFQNLKAQIEASLLNLGRISEESIEDSIPICQFRLSPENGIEKYICQSIDYFSLLPPGILGPEFVNNFPPGDFYLDVFLERKGKAIPFTEMETAESPFSLSFSSLVVGDSPIPSGMYKVCMLLTFLPYSDSDDEVFCLFQEMAKLMIYGSSTVRN